MGQHGSAWVSMGQQGTSQDEIGTGHVPRAFVMYNDAVLVNILKLNVASTCQAHHHRACGQRGMWSAQYAGYAVSRAIVLMPARAIICHHSIERH